MKPIPRTFFLTGLGRSGTAFLASALNRSQEYWVVHEWRIPKTAFRDGRLSRFPLWRFVLARHPFAAHRAGYGEVNSHLRRTLSATEAGAEALIEKRGVILRDPRDIITSGMNRNGRTEADFRALCDEAVRDFAHLHALINHPTLHYERFEFERFTTAPESILEIADWAGIPDLDVAPGMVERKVNTNRTDWFPRWSGWTSAQQRSFQEAASRYGVEAAADAIARS